MLKDALARLVGGQSLTALEAFGAMNEIMDGLATPAQIAAFLTALRFRGETVEVITGCARAMREHVVRVDPGPGLVLDTCGTGGDGRGTFNVSTLTAVVAAASGARVAKHGNRAASSRCGSADLLEALGVRIENPKEKIERMLREVGFAYLHAPSFHPAMRHAATVRKELGFRTLFNILGPLCNPASAQAQVIGVYSPDLVRPVGLALQGLGSLHVFAFHGHQGLDELSTTGENQVLELHGGRLSELKIGPETIGVPRAALADLQGGSVEDNVRIARDLLSAHRGPHRDIVLLNVALALVAAGVAKSPKEGAQRGAEAIDSGAARKKIDALIEASN
jgi:anthranilate phosphoribosyltransferase